MHSHYKKIRQTLPFVTVPRDYPPGGVVVTYQDFQLALYPYTILIPELRSVQSAFASSAIAAVSALDLTL